MNRKLGASLSKGSSNAELSARQTEIATLVAGGKSNREIANALNVSTRTIDTHVNSIFNKMSVRSRVELTNALMASKSSPQFQDPIPLRASYAIPNNLPRKLNSFIGRAAEIDAIRNLIETQQLVTLIGSAGVGKTRTSLEVAGAVLGEFIDGVWFIELAPLTEGDYIAAAIAQALGLTLPFDGDRLINLAKQLKMSRTLLVLDNCEHLIEPAAAAIATILRQCRTVKILASSREHLRVAGEATYRIPSLSLPNEEEAAKLQPRDLPQFEATKLFIQRARAADNRFAITVGNASAIAEICRRLDGIPLAIELAAARTSLLAPQQLRDQLGDRFRILTGGSRDAITRHQTLRALIDWSHDLLDERERRIFRRLGIFVHGFTFEAAFALSAGDHASGKVFDALAALVDKSLVLAESTGDTIRYRLLESTRLYAVEKLAMAGEQRPLERRHIMHLIDRFAELRAEADRTGRRDNLYRFFATELANIRAALDAADQAAETIVAADLLAQMRLAFISDAWLQCGRATEGIERHQRVLSRLRGDGDSRLIALLLGSLSSLLGEIGRQVEAASASLRALVFARTSCDAETLQFTLIRYSMDASSAGHFDEAGRALAQAKTYHVDSELCASAMLRSRAILEYNRGDFDAAVVTGEIILKKCLLVGDAVGVRLGAHNLARSEFCRGNPIRAIEIVRDNIVACQTARDRWLLAYSLFILAFSLADCGDVDGAAEAADEATELCSGIDPDGAFAAVALATRAYVFAIGKRLACGAKLKGYAAAAFHRHGYRLDPFESMLLAKLAESLEGGLAPSELERLTNEGSALTGEAAVAFALTRPTS